MPIAVIDNFAEVGLVEAAKVEWPSAEDGRWRLEDSGKRSIRFPHNLPVAITLLLHKLAVIDVARTLCLNVKAFPDLDSMHGAGLHEMTEGHHLGLHKDCDRHPIRNWKREVSAVLYLDTHEKGGELDLIGGDQTTLIQGIRPEENRLVLFTTPGQYHRVNTCLARRRSICLFFWSLCDADFQGDSKSIFY